MLFLKRPTVTQRYLFSFFVLLVGTSAYSQGFVERIEPPVVERGKTTRVTFVGRDLPGASNVWHSLDSTAIQAKAVESGPSRAVFDLIVAKDAPVGICGVRVATRDGLSNAHLLLVDDLPVRAASRKLELPSAIWNTFQEATLDRYEIQLPKGRMSFEIVGSRLGKDADPLLTIRDAKGRLILERDNDPGLYFDSRFEHDFTEAGTYTVEVREARYRGSEHQQYVLRIGRFPAGRVAIPSALRVGKNELRLPEIAGPAIAVEATTRQPGAYIANLRRPGDDGSSWFPITSTDDDVTIGNNYNETRAKGLRWASSPATTLAFNLSPLRANPFLALDALLLTGKAQATPAKVPGVLCGVLRTPGERQAFQFELAKGQKIAVRAEAKSLNSPVDLDVVLVDKVGREQRRANEVKDEITFDFTAQNAGTYGIMVRDQLRDGGPAFAYRITVVDGLLPPGLSAEVEGLTIPQGTYQPIPITVARNGHVGPIALKLIGAPPGVVLVPDSIAENENAVVCRIEAVASTPLGIYAPQIIAEAGSVKTLVRTQPLIDKRLINVDLILHALREDQTRLPPSLTDRFALQIMPPSPFTMELPEKLITLARYQKSGVPVVTTREKRFAEPITLTAKGGQIADKNEGRTRVYAEFADATPSTLSVNGVVVSKILSNIGKTRIEVSATAIHQGRRVTLTRTFELDLTTAFTVSGEPKKLALLPGESAKMRIVATRVKSFDGDVRVELPRINGLSIPETVVIPKGQSGVDVEIRVLPDAMPNRHNLQGRATSTVDGFEEEQRGQFVEVEVRKVEVPTKK